MLQLGNILAKGIYANLTFFKVPGFVTVCHHISLQFRDAVQARRPERSGVEFKVAAFENFLMKLFGVLQGFKLPIAAIGAVRNSMW